MDESFQDYSWIQEFERWPSTESQPQGRVLIFVRHTTSFDMLITYM